jgi:hypothetical protein
VQVSAPPEFGSMSTCIKDTVRRWRFPPSGDEYDVPFPLVLTPTSG